MRDLLGMGKDILVEHNVATRFEMLDSLDKDFQSDRMYRQSQRWLRIAA